MCDKMLITCVILDLLCFFLVFTREQLKNPTTINVHRTFCTIGQITCRSRVHQLIGCSSRTNPCTPISTAHPCRIVQWIGSKAAPGNPTAAAQQQHAQGNAINHRAARADFTCRLTPGGCGAATVPRSASTGISIRRATGTADAPFDPSPCGL